MRKIPVCLLVVLFPLAVFTGLRSCTEDLPPGIDLREEMRSFVMGIGTYARAFDSTFMVIPQNGIELVSETGEADGVLHTGYLDAIDGHGQEDLFYGYDRDDEATPEVENQFLRAFLDRSKDEGHTILVTDYCSTPSKMDDSFNRNHAAGYVSFAADRRELDAIPIYPSPVFGENHDVIMNLHQVRNFLYLINPESFQTKEAFLQAVGSTGYDLIIMDLFFRDTLAFTGEEIASLKWKPGGGSRLVVAYMSIGEAEDYRYYWNEAWKKDPPSWMEKENPRWVGNYKVRYWEEAWQAIIFGNGDSYLDRILEAGFDGVYLDIIDAFEYFE